MARVVPKFLLPLLCISVMALACNNNGSSDAAEKDAKQPATATGADDKPNDEPVDEIPNDIYPDFPFSQFSPEEKTRIVKLTKAELCPCPGANKSLHECVQKREERCALATDVMSTIGGMVKGAFNDTDILDQVAKQIENAKKVHEFKLDGRPLKGVAGAKVVLVEFADFQCGYCREASKVLKSTSERYGDDVAIYFKHYPLPAHPFAELAARASVAAHRQGKFWPMHDALFKNQKSLSPEKIESLAQRAGLNMGKFKADLESPDVLSIVGEDRKEGEASGISGTPTIFINGKKFLGNPTEDEIHEAIDGALKGGANSDTTTTN